MKVRWSLLHQSDEEISQLKDIIAQNNQFLAGHDTRLANYQKQLNNDLDKLNRPEKYYVMNNLNPDNYLVISIFLLWNNWKRKIPPRIGTFII